MSKYTIAKIEVWNAGGPKMLEIVEKNPESKKLYFGDEVIGIQGICDEKSIPFYFIGGSDPTCSDLVEQTSSKYIKIYFGVTEDAIDLPLLSPLFVLECDFCVILYILEKINNPPGDFMVIVSRMRDAWGKRLAILLIQSGISDDIRGIFKS